jgi:hypothetical protein
MRAAAAGPPKRAQCEREVVRSWFVAILTAWTQAGVWRVAIMWPPSEWTVDLPDQRISPRCFAESGRNLTERSIEAHLKHMSKRSGMP